MRSRPRRGPRPYCTASLSGDRQQLRFGNEVAMTAINAAYAVLTREEVKTA